VIYQDTNIARREQSAAGRYAMVSVTDSALNKLREMRQEDPSKGAFRVIFKGFG